MSMQGNPHLSKASAASPQLIDPETANESYVAEEGITDQTMQFGALNRIAEATLALAFEHRTANLIAFEVFMERVGSEVELAAIEERLGLK